VDGNIGKIEALKPHRCHNIRCLMTSTVSIGEPEKMKRLPPKIMALAIAAMPVLAPATVLSVLPIDQAEAQNRGIGNGNGNGNGNGGGNRSGEDRGGPPEHANAGGHGGRDRDSEAVRRTGPPAHANAGGSQHGRIARELGGANASNASAQAFANAADGSMIGRLRDVHGVFGETDAAFAAVTDAQNAYDEALAAYLAGGEDRRLREEIEALIDDVDERIADLNALDPAPEDFATQLATLEEERLEYTGELEAYVAELGEVEEALETASMGYAEALETENEALADVTNSNFELSEEARTNCAAGSTSGSATRMRRRKKRSIQKRPDALHGMPPAARVRRGCPFGERTRSLRRPHSRVALAF
jgi:hypothetical protein